MQESQKNADLDSLYLACLKTLQELHEKKQQLQKCVSSGYFSLSKARYVMGVQRVSKLHYGPVMKAETTADIRYDEDGVASFEVVRKSEIKRDTENTHSGEEKRSLKKRTNDKDAIEEDQKEESVVEILKDGLSEIDVGEEEVAVDPIKWFGILVPQTLRQSQTDFRKATVISGEICTLQSKLKYVQQEISKLKKDKDD